jgi:hypothetical protein
MTERTCSKCGGTVPKDVGTCPTCGTRYANPTTRACLIGCMIAAALIFLLFGSCVIALNRGVYGGQPGNEPPTPTPQPSFNQQAPAAPKKP